MSFLPSFQGTSGSVKVYGTHMEVLAKYDASITENDGSWLSNILTMGMFLWVFCVKYLAFFICLDGSNILSDVMETLNATGYTTPFANTC